MKGELRVGVVRRILDLKSEEVTKLQGFHQWSQLSGFLCLSLSARRDIEMSASLSGSEQDGVLNHFETILLVSFSWVILQCAV